MVCIACGSTLDSGVVRLAESFGVERLICATCQQTYTDREWVQMNVRIPVALDTKLRHAAQRHSMTYAAVVRDRLESNGT